MKKLIYLFTLVLISMAGKAQTNNMNYDSLSIRFCGSSPRFADSIARFSLNRNPLTIYTPAATLVCGHFTLYFDDIQGSNTVGFNDATYGLSRRNCLCSTLQYIETVLDIQTTDQIEIEVGWSTNNNGSTFLAQASPYFPSGYLSNTPGVYVPLSLQHIMSGSDPDASQFDGMIVYNFSTAHPLSNDCSTLPNCTNVSYDLATVSLHELTHALGFLSLMGEDSNHNLVGSGISPYMFTTFDDKFLYYGSTPLVPGTLTKLMVGGMLNSALPTLLNIASSNQIWLLDGSPDFNNQPIFSRSPYQLGTSLSHFEVSNSVGRNFDSPGFVPDYVMGPSLSTWQTRREYSAQDVRALNILGYNIKTTSPLYACINNHIPFTIGPIYSINHNYPDDPIGFGINPNLVKQTYQGSAINCNHPITIDLGSELLALHDQDNGDPIKVYYDPNTSMYNIWNIRGCSDGGNNYNQLTISPGMGANGSDKITFTPRNDFWGLAQFGFQLYDGKEKGTRAIYSIYVGNGTCYSPGSNLIMNGDMEIGTELKVNGDVNHYFDYLSESYNPIAPSPDTWHWYDIDGFYHFLGGTSDGYVKDSYSCNFGEVSYSYSPGSTPAAANGTSGTSYGLNRYIGKINSEQIYTTTTEPLLACHSYNLEFDMSVIVNNENVNVTIQGIPSLYSGPIYSVNSTITETGAVGTWQHFIIPFTISSGISPINFLKLYTTPTPTNYSNYYYDNFKLTDVTTNPPPPPTVTISPSNTICSGQSVSVTANGFTNYVWTDGVTTTTSNPLITSPTVSTLYTVIGTTGGCSSSATVPITVSPLPIVGIIPPASTTICTGTQITLSGTGASSYSWSGGINNGVAFTPSVGTHNYTVTGVLNGCSNTASITITVTPAIALNVSTTTNCNTGATTLIASGANTYVWSPSTGLSNPNIANPVANPTVTTTYIVTGTTGNCTATATVTVNPLPNCAINSTVLHPYNLTTNYAQTLVSANSGNPNITGWDIIMNGDLDINTPITFTDCNIIMANNTKIILEKDLVITKGTHIYNCCGMWDGIYVPSPWNLIINDNSLIEDAKHAVVSQNGGKYGINTAIFNQNYTTIEVQQFGSGTHPGTMTNSVITCRNIPSSPIHPILTNGVNPSVFTLKSNLISTNPYPTCAMHPNYTNLKSVYGIYATDVALLNIGDGSSASNNNTFDNLNIGIYLTRTNSVIYNNTFQNIVSVTGASSASNLAIFGTGTGPTGGYSVTIGNGTQNSANNFSNTFNNVYSGVYILYYKFNTVLNNTLTNLINTTSNGNMGIEINPSSNNSVDINYNRVTNFKTGIWLYRDISGRMNGTNSHIESNKVFSDATNGNAYCNHAISITDLGPGTPFFIHPVKIQYNNIQSINQGTLINGIVATNVGGILSIAANYDIGNNTGITLFNPTSNSGSGIEVDKCYKASVVENYDIHSFGNVAQTNLNYKGIFVTLSLFTQVFCNSIHHVGQSMTFKDDNMPSYVYNNTMDHGKYGLVLDQPNAKIGPQGSWNGSTGLSCGESWSNFIAPPNGYDTYCTNSANAALSPLYGTFLNPTNGFIVPSNPYLNGIWSSTSTATYLEIPTFAPTYNCSSYPIIFQSPILTPSELKSLAYDSTAYAIYQQQIQYYNKTKAYDVLDSTDALTQDTTGLLQLFYDSAKVAAMGKFKDVGKYIVDKDYVAANTKNNEVTPSNGVEANKKAVNYYYLLRLKDSTYQYSSADSAAIYAIASQCPSEGGAVVWEARVLYYGIVNDIINFENDCEAIGKSLTHMVNKPTTPMDNFNLFPNPNNGSMILVYHLVDNENGTLSIYDLVGRAIRTYPVNSKTSILTINENELNAGTYYYSIRVNDKIVKTEKIIIIK